MYEVRLNSITLTLHWVEICVCMWSVCTVYNVYGLGWWGVHPPIPPGSVFAGATARTRAKVGIRKLSRFVQLSTPHFVWGFCCSCLVSSVGWRPVWGRVCLTLSRPRGGGLNYPRVHFCNLLRHLDQQPKFLPWLFLNIFSAQNDVNFDFLWLCVMTPWRVKVTSFFLKEMEISIHTFTRRELWKHEWNMTCITWTTKYYDDMTWFMTICHHVTYVTYVTCRQGMTS